MMPWKSKAQERWGNSPAGKKALGAKGVQEFNSASKGAKLPEKVAPVKKNSYKAMEKADKALDKKQGVKEGSKADLKKDAKQMKGKKK